MCTERARHVRTSSVSESHYLELIVSPYQPAVGRPLGRYVALKGDLQPGQVMFYHERLTTLGGPHGAQRNAGETADSGPTILKWRP